MRFASMVPSAVFLCRTCLTCVWSLQEPQSPVAQSAFASAPSLASSTFDAAAEQAPAPAVGQPASIPARFDSFGTQYDDFGATPAARAQSRTGDVHSSITNVPGLQS